MANEETGSFLVRVRELKDRAAAYFTKANEALAGVARPDKYGIPREPDFFWTHLPTELQDEAMSLLRQLIDIVPAVSPAIRRSPVLTEADERDVGHAVKGMRAALRLRRYVHWDTEVLHDEGTVLGVRSSGQEDDDPLHPEDAMAVFSRFSDQLENVVSLISPLDGDIPAAFPVPKPAPAMGYRPGTAFIMMWMDPAHSELDDVSDTVKRCFSVFGINAVRADDIQHEDLITKRILDEIKTAEFLFADLTGERPSVYYEVGYAHAIGRRAILFRKKGTNIHFDLAGYNCPEYENLRDLESQLNKRLEYVTGERHVETIGKKHVESKV